MCLNCCLIGMPELHLKCYDPACLTRADGKSGKINGVEMLRKSHGRVHVGGKGTWVCVRACVRACVHACVRVCVCDHVP